MDNWENEGGAIDQSGHYWADKHGAEFCLNCTYLKEYAPEHCSKPNMHTAANFDGTVFDPVDKPAHYNWLPGGIEVIDITSQLGFCLGNVIKYCLRADRKGNDLEDLAKAAKYLDFEIKRRKGEPLR